MFAVQFYAQYSLSNNLVINKFKKCEQILVGSIIYIYIIMPMTMQIIKTFFPRRLL